MTALEAARILVKDHGNDPDYEDVVTVARAYIAAVEWRPIASAPQDGSEILAFIPAGAPSGGAKTNRRQCVMRWYDHPTQSGYWIGANLRGKPTHWLPLPAPPKETQ